MRWQGQGARAATSRTAATCGRLRWAAGSSGSSSSWSGRIWGRPSAAGPAGRRRRQDGAGRPAGQRRYPEPFRRPSWGSTTSLDQAVPAERVRRLPRSRPDGPLRRAGGHRRLRHGPSAVGPFYCPADQTVYLDPTFFDELEQKLGGSKAEFARPTSSPTRSATTSRTCSATARWSTKKADQPKQEFNKCVGPPGTAGRLPGRRLGTSRPEEVRLPGAGRHRVGHQVGQRRSATTASRRKSQGLGLAGRVHPRLVRAAVRGFNEGSRPATPASGSWINSSPPNSDN